MYFSYCVWGIVKKSGYFWCKIHFRTPIILIQGQKYTQKNHKKLKVKHPLFLVYTTKVKKGFS